LPDRWAVRSLAKIEQWSRGTTSGDLAEIDGLDERSSVIPLVTSTRENCLGSECPDHRSCYVMKARRDAMAADLVVVNHHLFFADMALRDSGVTELLPSVEVAIFDEAHQLTEAGVQFLGTTLGSAQVLDFARDMLGAGLQQARGLAPWQDLAARCEMSARELRLASAGPLWQPLAARLAKPWCTSWKPHPTSPNWLSAHKIWPAWRSALLNLLTPPMCAGSISPPTIAA
jgi:ATP-dependent DNA helicase DinG